MSNDPYHKASRILTEREHETAVALGRGEKPSAIAKRMGVGICTIYSNQQKACERLGIYGRAQLAAYAREMGWTENKQEQSA